MCEAKFVGFSQACMSKIKLNPNAGNYGLVSNTRVQSLLSIFMYIYHFISNTFDIACVYARLFTCRCVSMYVGISYLYSLKLTTTLTTFLLFYDTAVLCPSDYGYSFANFPGIIYNEPLLFIQMLQLQISHTKNNAIL